MKNAKFKSFKQNVYVTYTGGGSREFTELYCIAIGEAEAEKLVEILNLHYSKENN